jgi:hypothetical protein
MEDFAVSPNGDMIVFNEVGPNEHGGPLYLLQTSSREPARLTPPAREVYSDPEFSPDGDLIVFAIHAQATGDLVESAGPLGIIDIRTHQLTVLSATANIAGHGPFYSNEPHWSLDGKHILFSFEAGAAEVDADGKNFKDLSPLPGGDWSHAVRWIGSKCAAYIAGRSQKDGLHGPLRVINLETRKTDIATQLFSTPEDAFHDLVAFSPELHVRMVSGKLRVEGGQHSWELPVKNPRGTTVKVLSQGDPSRVPPACM